MKMIFFYGSLPILIFALGALMLNERSFGVKFKSTSFYKKFFLISTLVILFELIILSYLQYIAWQGDAVMKYSLPPYENLNFFIIYISGRFLAPYVLSLIAAILFVFISKYLNKKYSERFFYDQEYWLAALAIFLSGYPGFLFLFVVVILIILIGSVITKGRFSSYYIWIPTAIFAILIQKLLQSNQLWMLLKI